MHCEASAASGARWKPAQGSNCTEACSKFYVIKGRINAISSLRYFSSKMLQSIFWLSLAMKL